MAENASIADAMSQAETELEVPRGTEPERKERVPENRGSKHRPEAKEAKTPSLRDIPNPGEAAPVAVEPGHPAR